MTELEVKVNKIESDQRSFEATVKMYMQKMDKDMEDFKTELRDRDNQRHEEILNLRQEMSSLREELSNLTKHLQTTSITMSAGIGALVVTMIVYLLTKG
ncbi:MAG: hypothetical protein IJ728_05575 [Selenomonadaceae bacterium]|nr:hypothetical protein [Selenomonadaceae bacterium]